MRLSAVLASLPLLLYALHPVQAQEVLTGEAAFGTSEADAPGVRRHIKPADMPPPSHTDNDPEAPDFKNMATVVPAPAGAMPKVPKGFKVEIFASGLNEPRVIRVAPNGDIFVAESASDSGTGRVLVFPADGAGQGKPETFSEGLDRPFGIVFFPPAEPTHVYVASADKVVRYPYSSGDRKSRAEAETVIADIPTERHWTRDLAVSRDGAHLYVSIGSASNVAAAMPEMTEDKIKAHEKTHGVGAAWGDEENRAMVRVFNPDGSNVRNFATGLRNCSAWPSSLARIRCGARVTNATTWCPTT